MDESRTVWCGNLSDKVTEEILFELFLQAAPLEKVRIPTDKEGRKSNFGFITFKHEQSVDYALQLLNGVRLYDKCLTIKPRSSNSNTTSKFADRNLSYNDSPLRFGNMSQQNQFQNRMSENRDNRQSSRGFRDNYREDRHRDSPYSRHDDRDRHDSYRRSQNYDRRNNFNDGGNNRRGNRYY